MSTVANADSEPASTSTVLILSLLVGALIAIGAWYYNAHHRVELNRLNGDTIAAPVNQAPAAPPGVPPASRTYGAAR